MELVHGVPITDYCDRQTLTTRERLDLIVNICGAVQHAHQKGVTHRDLKPSNILISEAEGNAVPKVIDFGVAKAMDRRLIDGTFFTEIGRLIGTPEYMSPEQAEMSGLDVDTRSDVYSLGVILYELLTGTLPFEPSELRVAPLTELQRIIRETEPIKPSTRLSAPGNESTRVADRRRTDLRSLRRQLRRRSRSDHASSNGEGSGKAISNPERVGRRHPSLLEKRNSARQPTECPLSNREVRNVACSERIIPTHWRR